MNDNINNTQNSKNSQSFLDYVVNSKNDLKTEILQAKEPNYIADLPVILAEVEDMAVLNMVMADSGAGKSLFSRSIVEYILSNYEDVIVIWIDLEYNASVSKERKIDYLLDFDNFYLITHKHISDLREIQRKYRTVAGICNEIIKEFRERFNDKRIFVIIDSFEDYIEDTSNDIEVKRHLFNMLSFKGVSYLINHHISKDVMKSNSLRFRGSMVIKAKLTSLLYILKKEKEDDFTILFELELLKIRTYYPPVAKLIVRVDTESFELKTVDISSDTEEIKVLKSAYYLLRKNVEMNKTELIETISKEVKKHKDKVRHIIDKNIEMFDVKKSVRRTEIFSLTKNVDVLDKYLSKLAIDNKITLKQVELLKELDNYDDNTVVNIELEVKDIGILLFTTIKSIKNYIYKLDDEEIDILLEKLREVNTVNTSVDDDDSIDF